MFDHRLGLALGRSVKEIHQLSYSEYKDWQLFYSVEPWGWQIEENRLARLQAFLFNIFKAKDVSPLYPSDFMIDINKVISDQEAEQALIEDYEKMSREQKQTYIMRELKLMFGGLLSDNRSNN